MKRALLLLLMSASAALGAKVGDTYESVIAEMGQPKSHMEGGAIRILGYPGMTIRFRDNVVISIEGVGGASPPLPRPSADAADLQPPAPGASADDVKALLKKAIDRVKLIVNQPVRFVPRTDANNSQCGWFGDTWFHPGAIRPDFAHVDIRKTQETKNYTPFTYVASNFARDRAYIASDVEFNSMTKFFYVDRSMPKKKLTEGEMLEINKLYRIIAACSDRLGAIGVAPDIK